MISVSREDTHRLIQRGTSKQYMCLLYNQNTILFLLYVYDKHSLLHNSIMLLLSKDAHMKSGRLLVLFLLNGSALRALIVRQFFLYLSLIFFKDMSKRNGSTLKRNLRSLVTGFLVVWRNFRHLCS